MISWIVHSSIPSSRETRLWISSKTFSKHCAQSGLSLPFWVRVNKDARFEHRGRSANAVSVGILLVHLMIMKIVYLAFHDFLDVFHFALASPFAHAVFQ